MGNMSLKSRMLIVAARLSLFLAPLASPSPAAAQTAAQLEYGGPLGDIGVLGASSAPVTVIYYAAMTCGLCEGFVVNTLPTVQQKYIATGKVRFIFREAPISPLDGAVFVVARCVGKEKYMSFIEALYARAAEWKTVQPIVALTRIAGEFGVTEAQMRVCLGDQKLVAHINAVRQYEDKVLHLTVAPWVYFNGQPINFGFSSLDQFDEAMGMVKR